MDTLSAIIIVIIVAIVLIMIVSFLLRGISSNDSKKNKTKQKPKKKIFRKYLNIIIPVTIIILLIGVFFSYQNNIHKQELNDKQRELDYKQHQLVKEQDNLAQVKKDKAESERLAQLEIQQKEAEKMEAENTLSEKEKQDILLAQDLDNDGLTLREEQNMGTDPLDPDSDNDKILDGDDTNPLGGGRYIVKVYNWIHSGQEFATTFRVHSDWYDYYKNKIRNRPYYAEYATPHDESIKDIASQLTDIKNQLNESCGSCIALDFVQSLPYVRDADTGYDEFPKFAIETLVDENGDCEDTSFLVASITKAMGLRTIIIDLPGHRAAGVGCTWDNVDKISYNGNTYCYIETTGDNRKVGEIPSKYTINSIEGIYPVN